jgi:dTDP-4-dehydrorhamnose 3,5-epimerase
MDEDYMIKDVVIQKLKQIIDDRGRVMHMLRLDNPLYQNFGEIYFSEILPGVIKAWKRHKKQTQLIAVPIGMIQLAIYDDREDSASQSHSQVMKLGRENYCLVKIPPGLWYGFRCISDIPALIANCTDLPHDPGESENNNLSELNLLWAE